VSLQSTRSAWDLNTTQHTLSPFSKWVNIYPLSDPKLHKLQPTPYSLSDKFKIARESDFYVSWVTLHNPNGALRRNKPCIIERDYPLRHCALMRKLQIRQTKPLRSLNSIQRAAIDILTNHPLYRCAAEGISNWYRCGNSAVLDHAVHHTLYHIV
jgi:hypothetical protein